MASPLSRNIAKTMCQTEGFKSHTCQHKWMTIVSPCKPGAGFSTNNYHQYTRARPGPLAAKFISAAANSCPSCDKKGEYDGNVTRMVSDQKDQWGGLGNGYSMTDGQGNVLPYGQGNGTPMPSHYGYKYTSCGTVRVSQPGTSMGCCNVM